MTIQDWGAIGEIVGGLAVVVTLIYLAVQLKQSNLSTHRAMYASAAEAVADFWLDLAKHPELFECYQSALHAPEGMLAAKRDQGFLVLDAYMSLMESYFLHNRTYGEITSQARWSRTLAHIFNMPGGRLYWQGRRIAFHDDFASYVDDLVKQT